MDAKAKGAAAMRLGRLLSILSILAVAATAVAQDARFFRIATGTTGGTYFPIGGILANAVSNPPGARPCERGGSCGVPGLIAVAQATSGAVENAEMLGNGQIDSGFVQADIALWAFEGNGPFAGKPPARELRTIAALYPESMHIVVRQDSDIRSVSDLRGKRVSLGDEGSGTLVEARLILEAFGLREKDVVAEYLRPGPSADKLVSGGLDAFFIIGGTPIQAVGQAASHTPIRLLPIPETEARRLAAEHAFFAPAEVPAGTYGIPEATPTVGVMAQWVTTTKVDDDLVYALTKALWHETTEKALQAGHPQGRNISLARALRGLAVPLHPGAARYYDEIAAAPSATGGPQMTSDGERSGRPGVP